MAGQKEKVVLSTRDFYHLTDIENIVFCQSNNTYTTFYLNEGDPIRVSVPLKKVELQLNNENFIRIHQSYLVNTNYVKGVHKAAEGNLLLSNGVSIPISTRKKKEVLQFLNNIKRIQI